MESKDELKKIDIKNRTCYYFDDIMTVIDIDFSGILLNKKSYKLIFNLWHFKQNFHGCKTIVYLVQKIDGFFKIYDGVRYLVLFTSKIKWKGWN